MSLAERRRVELRNGLMVLWRRMPVPAALVLGLARFGTMIVRCRRERHELGHVMSAVPDAVRTWRANNCRRDPVRWRTLARYLALHRSKEDR
jgi:hypothetical protein